MTTTLSLADAKAHLNITTDDFDAKITDVIAAAEAAIEQIVGPISSTEVTVRAQSTGGATVLLSTLPALSLVSVAVDGGTTLDVTGLTVDRSGVVTFNSGAAAFTGRGYTVTYLAGRDPVPADLLFAVKEMVRHLWASQRGPTARPGSLPSETLANTLPGAAYAMPIRVAQLLAPHMMLAGFA